MDINLPQLLFSFKGRIGRQYWWLTSLAVAVLLGIASSLVEVAAKTSGSGSIDPESGQFEPSAPYALLVFALASVNLWINFALGVKRLHDRERSGWWLVGQTAILAAAIALVLAAFMQPEEVRGPWLFAAGGVGMVALAMSLWLFVELGFLRGTQGPNRYGPDPLGAAREDAVL